MNLHTLIFQNLRDSVKETEDGSRNMRSYIPLGRLILDILKSQLIDSLTSDQFSKGMKPLASRMLNSKGLKNTGIITDVTTLPTEISKEFIHNRRIPLEDFPIFLKPYPLW